MDIDVLLERFGTDTGLGRLALDEANTCSFLVDGMRVSLLHVVEGDRLLLYADVEDLPDSGTEALLLSVLSANYLFRGTAGATLAVRPDSRTLFLNQSLHLEHTSYDDFVQTLSDFTHTLAEWKRLIADYRPALSEAGPAAEAFLHDGIRI